MSYVRPHPRPWHCRSTFGPGRHVKLDREQRARFKWLVRADRRHNRLSATGEDVAIVLVNMLGENGQLDPTHATLADRVGCDVSTVRRCLDRLRDLQRLTWDRRLRRDRSTGGRCQQTSNAYVLTPDRYDPRSAGEHHIFEKVRKTSGLHEPRPMQPATEPTGWGMAPADSDLLAARRVAFERGQRNNYLSTSERTDATITL